MKLVTIPSSAYGDNTTDGRQEEDVCSCDHIWLSHTSGDIGPCSLDGCDCQRFDETGDAVPTFWRFRDSLSCPHCEDHRTVIFLNDHWRCTDCDINFTVLASSLRQGEDKEQQSRWYVDEREEGGLLIVDLDQVGAVSGAIDRLHIHLKGGGKIDPTGKWGSRFVDAFHQYLGIKKEAEEPREGKRRILLQEESDAE